VTRNLKSHTLQRKTKDMAQKIDIQSHKSAVKTNQQKILQIKQDI
jgi:hypothetical protein